ncbi:alginate lyase family protein [Pistricoccus aurantiacus]|uniref:alginate lyase family protein n=1 Tax=Pistricoccus aurantiacus TaxID=1883414 RepID=UPI003628145E
MLAANDYRGGLGVSLFRRCSIGILLLTCLVTGPAYAELMTLKKRQQLDLSQYSVTNPEASYFDVATRKALLASTDNSLLLQSIDNLSGGMSCRQLLEIPPITNRLRIPGFYPDPQAWRQASQPLFQFEDSVSNLAGAFVATDDDYYAQCLGRFLDQWASQDALVHFHYSPSDRQAWYATESMIFAAAMAYSIVRPELEDQPEQRERIEDWFSRLAYRHAYVPNQTKESCCNNHFYRRALYATMIGVLTEDNELFRYGVGAVYSALNEMTQQGGLPRELARGRRAVHYQNYALMYLVTNMQIISRQGYDIFHLKVDGHTIKDAVDFLLDAIEDASILGENIPREQYHGFLRDNQYSSWMEIYQQHFSDPRIAEFLITQRPIYNRSAGGYVTLFFMDPTVQKYRRPKTEDEEKQQLSVYGKESSPL